MRDLAAIARGEWLLPPWRNAAFRGMAIDSRLVKKRNAFVCLKGENTDGHRFAIDAVSAGASLIIAQKIKGRTLLRTLRPLDARVAVLGVDDPLTTMGDLTIKLIADWSTEFLAVTGSVGKTTAKEMLAASLSATGPVLKSPGNFNNLIGIPLALFNTRRITSRGVLEFGMSTPGEIARLTDMIQPRVGVYTRIGAAHLENFASLTDIARAKRELLGHLPEGGTAVLNTDDPIQRRWAARLKKRAVTYALLRAADFTAKDVVATGKGIRFRLNGRHSIDVPVYGRFNAANALAACAAARVLGLSYASIAEGLRQFKPITGRFQFRRIKGVTIINDAYNANPISMSVALSDLLNSDTTGRRIAVLAGMRELGPQSKQFHQKVGASAAQADVLVTIGGLGRWIREGAIAKGMKASNSIHVANPDGARDTLDNIIRQGDRVLFKGSNAEKVGDLASWYIDHRLAMKGKC